jgi:hypothetical protein
MIRDEVYAQELAKTAAQLDGGFALVLHSSSQRSEDDPYIRLLRGHNSTNLFLSLEPVPFDQVDAVFASATIGLAFYRPIDENFAQIALASGKLPFYLKHGIPILLNDLPSTRALIERHHCGALVADPASPADLASAVGTIMANYADYCANARRCFREEFDFDVKCAPVREFLETL